jgi:glycosyltransferase involved in cell wall biosynthesis
MAVTVTALGVHQGALQAFDERVELNLFQHPRRGRRKRGWGLADWLKSEARRFDVVHVHSVYTSTTRMVLEAARSIGKPVVLTPHGALMTGAIRPWQIWKLAWVWAWLQRGSMPPPLIHALSQLELDRSAWAGLRGFVHAPMWRLRVGLTGRPAARDGDYVLALGRVHSIKRLDLLLRALSSAEGLRLVVAGSGEETYMARLKRLSERLGVAARVTWVGRVAGDVKAALLRRARCLAQASRVESFGVAVLEAMAAGVPVAVGAGVAAAEWVESSGAGLVVGGEVDEWSAALQSIGSEPSRWDAMAANAALWSESLPSRDEQGAELGAFYGGLSG